MATGKTRRAAAAWLGGMMYALFAAFGWQAQHLGRCAPVPGLATAAVMTPLLIVNVLEPKALWIPGA